MSDRFDTANWTPTALLAAIAGLLFTAARRVGEWADDAHDIEEDDE